MSEVSREFQIVNEKGLHARAATRLVQLAARFSSEVVMEKDGQTANAKSVMGMLLLCGAKGTWVTVHAKGADAEEALKQIGELIASKFGEPA